MLILDRVSQLVDQNPQAFINGDKELAEAALKATKHMFDLSVEQENIAHSAVTELIRSYEPDTKPVTRSQAKAVADKERASTSTPSPPPPRTNKDIWKLTPIDSLLLDGMDDDQVWAQLELRTSSLCETLQSMLERDPTEDDEDLEIDEEGEDDEEDEELELEFDGFEDGDEEGEDYENDEDEQDKDIGLDESSDDGDLPEETASLHDPSDEETASEEEEDEKNDGMDLDRPTPVKSKSGSITISASKSGSGKKKGGHPVLDDDFFSLADFKAEIEEAEAKRVSRGRLGDDEDEEDEELESDLDLFVPVDDTNFDEEDLEAGMSYYNDFFAPPSKELQSSQPKKKKIAILKPKKNSLVRFNDEVKVRNIKSTGKGLSLKDLKLQTLDDEDDEDFPYDLEDDDQDDSEEGDEGSDTQNQESGEDDETDEDEDGDGDEGRDAIERFKDDLFADDSEEEGPSKNLSTYESRQAEIATQIKQLEEENVAPKSWTLMGEATVRQRPVNSLLEEDLEFERVVKPVPVVTEESVSSLEEMIKTRILDSKFDDVVRKRSVEDKPFLPSRLFELDDKKSSKGLAEIYADEYTAAASGTSTDVRDEKLKQQHAELTETWEKICYKLDALTNAHFAPKPPKASITTISNVATATMESALPTAVSTATMLAPEEIYAPDSSALRSKEEMTPIEKKSLRNKQRTARKKAQDIIKSARDKLASNNNKPFGKSVKKAKEKALKSVVKTGKGVSVVGKQSQKQNDRQASSKNLKL